MATLTIVSTGHSALLLMFQSSLFFSLPPNLQGRLADRHRTLPHVRWWPRFMKFGKKFEWPLPLEIWRPENLKFWRDFRQLCDLITNICGTQQLCDLNATRHHQSENGVANYGHSRTGKLNLVYFGPQTAKNRTGVLTHPPAMRTGINRSIEFARWRHWTTQRAAITLGSVTHLVSLMKSAELLSTFKLILEIELLDVTAANVNKQPSSW